jgi:hypothetical protein
MLAWVRAKFASLRVAGLVSHHAKFIDQQGDIVCKICNGRFAVSNLGIQGIRRYQKFRSERLREGTKKNESISQLGEQYRNQSLHGFSLWHAKAAACVRLGSSDE